MGSARKVSVGDRTSLSISRRTAAFHLDNAKTKFGVRTICQAVAKLAAAKSTSE